MRKVWTGLLALVLVAALCAPLLVSAYADAMVYYVNTANKKSLNMRSSTDLGNNILTSIPNGAAVVVYEFLNSNTWAHIGYGGRDGYVMTRYLSLTPPSTQPQHRGKPILQGLQVYLLPRVGQAFHAFGAM